MLTVTINNVKIVKDVDDDEYIELYDENDGNLRIEKAYIGNTEVFASPETLYDIANMRWTDAGYDAMEAYIGLMDAKLSDNFVVDVKTAFIGRYDSHRAFIMEHKSFSFEKVESYIDYDKWFDAEWRVSYMENNGYYFHNF